MERVVDQISLKISRSLNFTNQRNLVMYFTSFNNCISFSLECCIEHFQEHIAGIVLMYFALRDDDGNGGEYYI